MLAQIGGGTSKSCGGGLQQLNGRVDALDQRVGVLSSRLDEVGALDAALALTAPDGRIAKDNHVGVGVGDFRGHQALGIGYSRLVSASASVRAGVAIGGGSNDSAGVGVEFGW